MTTSVVGFLCLQFRSLLGQSQTLRHVSGIEFSDLFFCKIELHAIDLLDLLSRGVYLRVLWRSTLVLIMLSCHFGRGTLVLVVLSGEFEIDAGRRFLANFATLAV